MLAEQWTIRKAMIDDLDYFLESYNHIYGIQYNKEAFLELFKKKLKSQASLLCVAVNTLGHAIGCIVCEKQESFQFLKPVLQIKEFFISPKYRKLHLADELYSFVENIALKSGITKIEVMCNLTATTTQYFYLKKKFTLDRKTYVKAI